MVFIDIDGKLLNPSKICSAKVCKSKDGTDIRLHADLDGGYVKVYSLVNLAELKGWDELHQLGPAKMKEFRDKLLHEITEFVLARFPCARINLILKELSQERLNTFLSPPDQK